jgi:hypothetical protein
MMEMHSTIVSEFHLNEKVLYDSNSSPGKNLEIELKHDL